MGGSDRYQLVKLTECVDRSTFPEPRERSYTQFRIWLSYARKRLLYNSGNDNSIFRRIVAADSSSRAELEYSISLVTFQQRSFRIASTSTGVHSDRRDIHQVGTLDYYYWSTLPAYQGYVHKLSARYCSLSASEDG